MIEQTWRELDPDEPPKVVWLRTVPTNHVALLLGAFDPPTNAHLAIARAVRRALGIDVALAMTKVLLDRPADALLDPIERLHLLKQLCRDEGFGLVIANRGTYLDVGRALIADGMSPTFVVGTDKLEQLSDPSFYDDAEQGVAQTFEELDFVVIPRGDHPTRTGLRVLAPQDVFDDDATRSISATQVRQRVQAGECVTDLVPPGVDLALRGYTSAR